MKKTFWKKCASLIIACVASFAMILPTAGCDSSSSSTPETVDFTQLTYVAFGDSITYGEVGSTGKQMDTPYPNLVASELQLKAVRNYGTRGAVVKTPSVPSDKPYILSQVVEATTKADIVSVMIGINDFGAGYALGTVEDTDHTVSVYGAYNYLAKELNKKYPNAFIFFMTPLKQYKSAEVNSQGYRLSDVAKAVKDVCAVKGLPVLDMYETCAYSLENDSKSDGLHPTQKFMATYATPQIVQFIQDNYSAK